MLLLGGTTPLLGETDLLTDPERAKTDGGASFIKWARLFLLIPASVNDKGRGEGWYSHQGLSGR